jgi:hypothetical protein
MKITRTWNMPNKHTFKIKPIKDIINKYIKDNLIIIDPFANSSKIGTITNDLNPKYKTTFNLDAIEFLKQLETDSADIVLYDPPYSFYQAALLYKHYGKEKLKHSVNNMKYWALCKHEIARVLKPTGICISFGWNSNGIGLKRGFKITEILIVPHGSANDTVCVVEKKIKSQSIKPENKNIAEANRLKAKKLKQKTFNRISKAIKNYNGNEKLTQKLVSELSGFSIITIKRHWVKIKLKTLKGKTSKKSI